MQKLQDELRKHGYPTNFPLDGSKCRFDRTKPMSGWFIGKIVTVRGSDFIEAWFGDWAANEKHTYRSEAPADEAYAREVADAYEKLMAEQRAKREADAEQAALDADKLWPGFSDRGSTPYMERKKIDSLYGARIESTPNGLNLVVPCRDLDGKLWGVQRIQPDGGKYFLKGQKIKGVCHVIGELKNGSDVYVAEGFATAVSCYLSTGVPIVCSFNSGNLLSVCTDLRAKYPESRIVLCADNDAHTVINGVPENVGLTKAVEAQKSVTNLVVVVPRFL